MQFFQQKVMTFAAISGLLLPSKIVGLWVCGSGSLPNFFSYFLNSLNIYCLELRIMSKHYLILTKQVILSPSSYKNLTVSVAAQAT